MSIPNARPRSGKIYKDEKTGFFYVVAARQRFYAPTPLPNFRVGQKVEIRFDVPGSRIVSVWRGDNLIGDFYCI